MPLPREKRYLVTLCVAAAVAAIAGLEAPAAADDAAAAAVLVAEVVASGSADVRERSCGCWRWREWRVERLCC